MVCAVAVPPNFQDKTIGDSKKLSDTRRRQAFKKWAVESPVNYHLVSASSERIDELGVYEALILAHKKAIETVLGRVQGKVLVVVDGFKDGTQRLGIPGSIGLPKADDLVPACSLASIIAKVTRDDLMVKLSEKYPGYGFGNHVGYGTPEHQLALNRLGPCEIHRKSYGPVAKALERGRDLELNQLWDLD